MRVCAGALWFVAMVLGALTMASAASPLWSATPQLVTDIFGRGAYRPERGNPALKLIRHVEPVLSSAPDAAPEPVLVEAVIRTDGQIEEARVSSKTERPEVARDVLQAGRSWAFFPPSLDGGSVRVLATFVVSIGPRALVSGPVYNKDEPEIELPQVIQAVLPGYTPDGLRQRISGDVEIDAIVLPSGLVGRASIRRSLDARYGLDRLALAAALQCRFVPARLAGTAVNFQTDIRYELVLK